jgi:hypothetical protein
LSLLNNDVISFVHFSAFGIDNLDYWQLLERRDALFKRLTSSGEITAKVLAALEDLMWTGSSHRHSLDMFTAQAFLID